MRQLKNFKKKIISEYEAVRHAITLNPKVIMWRLRMFRYSPFLANHILKITSVVIVIFCFGVSFYFFSWRSPSFFPIHSLVVVERGEPLTQITETFQERGIVRSAFWLRVFITLMDGGRSAIAGDYYFPEPKSIFGVASMLHDGKFGLIPIRVSIPEGLSADEIAEILQKSLPAFDEQDFDKKVAQAGLEGYLFPDTYFFMPNSKADDVILMMRETFARKIESFQSDLEKFGKPLSEIVTMASIVEGEARTLDSKRIVAGILWKRINLEMPLQVDAPFKYINGKNSFNLTKDDLAEDNPYNTYINKGLPPTPINNPGIDSLRAAMAPTNSEYLYFLSDKKGNIHYAKDFAGHQVNRELYLY